MGKSHFKYPENSVLREGHGQIPKLVMRDKELSQTAKLIYAYFCSYNGAGNQIFPSVATICEDLNMNPHTFYKYFKELEGKKYMVRIQGKHDAGLFASNSYSLLMEAPVNKAKITPISEALM